MPITLAPASSNRCAAGSGGSGHSHRLASDREPPRPTARRTALRTRFDLRVTIGLEDEGIDAGVDQDHRLLDAAAPSSLAAVGPISPITNRPECPTARRARPTARRLIASTSVLAAEPLEPEAIGPERVGQDRVGAGRHVARDGSPARRPGG